MVEFKSDEFVKEFMSMGRNSGEVIIDKEDPPFFEMKEFFKYSWDALSAVISAEHFSN